jgi:hypothetical protein
MQPSAGVTELETLLARIRRAKSVMLWDRYGRSSADDPQIQRMEASGGAAAEDRDAAMRALDVLVARLRVEAPAELAAWVDAHDALLAAFLAGTPEDTARMVATDERAAWAEVRAGTRNYVDENVAYVTPDPAQYRALFGIDP